MIPRRAILAALAGLLVYTPDTQAQSGHPSASCAAPFLRHRESIDRAAQFRSDLIVWSYDHQNVVSAYVALGPAMQALAPPSGTLDIGGVTFRFIDPPPGAMGPDDLWGIAADCGVLL